MFPRAPRSLRAVSLGVAVCVLLMLTLYVFNDDNPMYYPEVFEYKNDKVDTMDFRMTTVLPRILQPEHVTEYGENRPGPVDDMFVKTKNVSKIAKNMDSEFQPQSERADRRPLQFVNMQTPNNTAPPLVNPHPFEYIIHPGNICNGLYILVYIHTAPEHHKRRMVIRNTWGNQKYFPDIKIKVLFVMGATAQLGVQEALAYESEQYRDILQEDFMDAYKNLTYKGIAALKYITLNCQNVPFILKTDDDIFVNMFSLIRRLQNLPVGEERDLIWCLTWYGMKVMRDKNSKWYVSKEEFKEDTYPHYCSGSAFILSSDVAARMYNASFYTRFYWVDDFYITGLLAAKTGAPHRQLASAYELNFDKFENRFYTQPAMAMTYLFSHVHDLNRIQSLWAKIVVLVKTIYTPAQ